MAAVGLIGGCAHALREEAFQVRLDGAVFLGDDVPARLQFPRRSSGFRVEQVGNRRTLGRPNEFLFRLGQIACETVDAFRAQPDSPVRDFDVGKHVCLREIGLLRLRSLICVRCECGDVDQPRYAVVGARARNNASAIRVADEDGWTADPAQRTSYGGDVVRGCVEAVLGCQHLMPVRLKGSDHLAEAGTVSPKSVTEYDTGFGLLLMRCHSVICRRILVTTCRRRRAGVSNFLLTCFRCDGPAIAGSVKVLTGRDK